jgi:hypothetical protein
MFLTLKPLILRGHLASKENIAAPVSKQVCGIFMHRALLIRKIQIISYIFVGLDQSEM